MKPEQIQLHLEPSHDGMLTRLRLSGEILTCTPPPDFVDMVDCLATWSGAPVEIALPADCPDGHWFEWWTAVMGVVPADLLEIRFTLSKRPSVAVDLRGVASGT